MVHQDGELLVAKGEVVGLVERPGHVLLGFCALTDYLSVDPTGSGVRQQEARHWCAYIAAHSSQGEDSAFMESHKRQYGITFPALPLSTSFISRTLFLLLGCLSFSCKPPWR